MLRFAAAAEILETDLWVLFKGQSEDFREELNALAKAADKARRHLEEETEEEEFI
jgi:hypothetical protein